ncbi:MAG: tyrosine-type recombinase/integrase [Candidatus Heimdallarchaeaceae archaeon]
MKPQQLQTHTHEYEPQGNYYVCKVCQKKIIKFDKDENGVKVGVRSDGKKITKKTNKDRFFFPDEWTKFEAQLKDRQNFSCKCLLFTGARWQEIAKAQTKDFIYNPGGRSRIILRHTKSKAKKGENSFSGGKTRDIPISTRFAKYLDKHIRKNKLKDDDTFNILSKPGLNIAMKKAVKKAGLENPEDFSPHNLRKTLEVWLMASGVDSMKLLAHFAHDMNTAAQHYVSPDIFGWDDKKKIRQIIGDLYEGR